MEDNDFTRVYVMGKTDLIGVKDEQDITIPKMCSYNILIKQIACGKHHTHLLTQDGYVYSMGFNNYGVLGLGQGEFQLAHVGSPQLIQGLYCIEQIATGSGHTLALDMAKKVYAWGNPENGAIGPTYLSSTCLPVELSILGKLIQ